MLRIVFAEQENSNLNTASKNIMQTKKLLTKIFIWGCTNWIGQNDISCDAPSRSAAIQNDRNATGNVHAANQTRSFTILFQTEPGLWILSQIARTSMLAKREATIWDLPSPIHKASKKRKQSRSSNLCCSNEFQGFSEFQVFSLRMVHRIALDSEVWKWFLRFEWLRSRFHGWSSIKVDWQQNTKTQPPKNRKPKQTKIKPIRLLLLLISTSTIVPKVAYFQICQGPSKNITLLAKMFFL